MFKCPHAEGLTAFRQQQTLYDFSLYRCAETQHGELHGKCLHIQTTPGIAPSRLALNKVPDQKFPIALQFDLPPSSAYFRYRYSDTNSY